jgi:hypothetical protein
MKRTIFLSAWMLLSIGIAAAQNDAQLPPSKGSVVWSADMETGLLDQWLSNAGYGGQSQAEYDSGSCTRPVPCTSSNWAACPASSDFAHSGTYSMKLTLNTSVESGCRQFRNPEPKSGETFYYDAWLYVPVTTTVTGTFWNIFQTKTGGNHNPEDPVFVVDLLNRSGVGTPLRLRLRWKNLFAGPYAASVGKCTNTPCPTPGNGNPANYDQGLKDVTPGTWTHIEMYLKQSTTGNFDGQQTWWQDGTLLWNFVNIKTRDDVTNGVGDNRWSINSYSDGLTSNTIYWDDATISSPGPNAPTNLSATAH